MFCYKKLTSYPKQFKTEKGKSQQIKRRCNNKICEGTDGLRKYMCIKSLPSSFSLPTAVVKYVKFMMYIILIYLCIEDQMQMKLDKKCKMTTKRKSLDEFSRRVGYPACKEKSSILSDAGIMLIRCYRPCTIPLQTDLKVQV